VLFGGSHIILLVLRILICSVVSSHDILLSKIKLLSGI